MQKIIGMLVLFGIFTSAVWAETIHLKNGDVIQGEIVRENSLAVILRSDGDLKTIMVRDIERREGDRPAHYAASGRVELDTARFPEVGIVKANLIARLVEVNGTHAAMKQRLDKIIAEAPADQQEFLRQIFDVNEILTRLIPAYAEQFSVSELEQLIQFYESSTGQKLLAVTPKLMEASLREALQYFQEKVKDYQTE